MKRSLKLVSAFAALLLALTVVAGPAVAAPPDQSGNVERFISETGLFYGNGEYVVVTGPAFEEGCFGEGFPEVTAQLVNRGNGSFSETFHVSGVDAMVFEYGGDAFDVIGANCDAVANGEPLVFEPIAVGSGRHSFKVTGDENGVHVRNSFVGKVTTTDGRRVHVNTFASFDDGPAGLENLVQRVNYKG